ncbi:hypothetical protein A9Q81_14585 [Gammaproteobacteria bacterium 42_54_T18]|nr:hypothetical protein A9Q81_14585 [Gammaproteobacteria bacterium 42_54_T18]
MLTTGVPFSCEFNRKKLQLPLKADITKYDVCLSDGGNWSLPKRHSLLASADHAYSEVTAYSNEHTGAGPVDPYK